MTLTQKLDLRKLLVPELNHSLKILSLPLVDLKSLIDEELVNNPFLEEKPAVASTTTGPSFTVRSTRMSSHTGTIDEDFDPFAQLAKMPSLQDVLLRQLKTSALSDEELRGGKEIIGNIDDNGYLKTPLDEIAARQRLSTDIVERTLRIIQGYEPYGVAARTIQECLTIQCDALNMNDPLLKKIIACHLDDVAKRKYELIARQQETSVNNVEACIKKLTTLDPKPGQNYSTERPCDIIPDIFIDEKNGELDIFINKENVPTIIINEEYRHILKKTDITPEAKAFLTDKLQEALELLRSISRRQSTIRKVMEVVTSIQKEAIISGMSHLKPLTFQEVADKIGMHSSTVCRVVMNKHAQTPQGVIAVKSFFTSSIAHENGDRKSTRLNSSH